MFWLLSELNYLVPVLDTGPQKNQQYQKIHIGYGLCLCDPVSGTIAVKLMSLNSKKAVNL